MPKNKKEVIQDVEEKSENSDEKSEENKKFVARYYRGEEEINLTEDDLKS